MINFIKNFAIAFLMILAVYQTTELWFGNYSDHNFFSFNVENTTNKVSEDNSSLNSIIINLGNNKALTEITNINKNEYKATLDLIIKNILKKGTVKEKSDISWNNILSKQCFIYKYDFKLNKEIIESIFNVKNNSLNNVDNVDIIIVMADESKDNVCVRLVNSDNNNAITINLKKSSYVKEMEEIFNVYNFGEEDVYYISSQVNSFSIFNKNIFIPRWNEESLKYKQLYITKSFEDNVEKYADLFFDNPAGKWASIIDDIYTFSDENNVVKFYPYNVMEYSGYKSGKTTENNFYDDYLLALSFINRDNVSNSVFLSDYYKENEKSIFLFDYTLDNKPVYLSDEIKEKTGLNAFIEVTVLNGVVTKYLRYGCNVSEKQDISYGKIDFVTAIDNILTEKNIENKRVDNLKLGYVVDESSSSALNWIVNVDNENYIKNID